MQTGFRAAIGVGGIGGGQGAAVFTTAPQQAMEARRGDAVIFGFTCQTEQGQQLFQQPGAPVRVVAGAWIGATDVCAHRANLARPIARINEIVARFSSLHRFDAGDCVLTEAGERLAALLPADHGFGQRSRHRVAALGFLISPAPKAIHVLLQLAQHQKRAVAAKVALVGLLLGHRQRLGVLRVGGQQRAFAVQAVFVAITEQEFADSDAIVIVHVEAGADVAGAVPIDIRLRHAVLETEGLEAVHVAGGQALHQRQTGGQCVVLQIGAGCGDLLLAGKHHQQHMGLSLADAPQPVLRSVGGDVTQALRAIGRIGERRRELRRELAERVLTAQGLEPGGAQCDLQGLFDGRFVVADLVHARHVGYLPAQPAARRRSLFDAQQ